MMKASYISGIIQPKVIMTLGAFFPHSIYLYRCKYQRAETYRPGLIKHTNYMFPCLRLSSVLRSGPLSVFWIISSQVMQIMWLFFKEPSSYLAVFLPGMWPSDILPTAQQEPTEIHAH